MLEWTQKFNKQDQTWQLQLADLQHLPRWIYSVSVVHAEPSANTGICSLCTLSWVCMCVCVGVGDVLSWTDWARRVTKEVKRPTWQLTVAPSLHVSVYPCSPSIWSFVSLQQTGVKLLHRSQSPTDFDSCWYLLCSTPPQGGEWNNWGRRQIDFNM